MSKEKVALLQKTFSLRARASIDDCPIKNGSCTVFENYYKKSHFLVFCKRSELQGVPTSFRLDGKLLVKMSKPREIRILSKKFVKLKEDQHCLA